MAITSLETAPIEFIFCTDGEENEKGEGGRKEGRTNAGSKERRKTERHRLSNL